MLTGLRVSSLACKRRFYGPRGDPMEMDSEVLEMQK